MPGRSLTSRFGARVRAVRHARGMSQADLAARVGVSANHLGVIERGEKSPTLETVEAIAVALDLAVAELVSETIGATDPDAERIAVLLAAVPKGERDTALRLLAALSSGARTTSAPNPPRPGRRRQR